MFDRLFSLWVTAVLLATGTIALVLWQLDFVTPIACLNLDIVSVWCLFAAVFYAAFGKFQLASRILLVIPVPIFSSLALVFLMSEELRNTSFAMIVGSAPIGFLIGAIALWCLVEDKKNEVGKHASQSQ